MLAHPPKGCSPDVLVYLASEYRSGRKPPTLQQVFDEILFLFDLTSDEVLCSRKFRGHVIFRQLFSYVAPILTRASLANIAKFLGGFDHSTISNHRGDVKDWIKNDDETFGPIWRYYRIESRLWNKYNICQTKQPTGKSTK